MKTAPWLMVTALMASLFNVGLSRSVKAEVFNAVEVNQDRFVAVAVPYGINQRQYDLLILEQLSNQRACWQENGSDPTQIDPLLLNFDFTGICGRSTDSNGYSIRVGNEDLGLDYLLRLVKRNNELVLVGTPMMNRKAPEVEIGRTQGLSDGYLKINLNPGWRFTKRMYNGTPLGHIYLTGDTSTVGQIPASSTSAIETSSPSSSRREYIFTAPQETNTFTPSRIPSPPPLTDYQESPLPTRSNTQPSSPTQRPNVPVINDLPSY
ncbi:MAG: DUF3747 domain-containing protein [Chroococcales cyanobacterium]